MIEWMVTDNKTMTDMSNTQLMKYHSHPLPLFTLSYKNTASTIFKTCYHPAENAYLDTSKRYTLNDLLGYSRCLFKNRLLNDVIPRATCIKMPNSPRSSHSLFSPEFYSFQLIFLL